MARLNGAAAVPNQDSKARERERRETSGERREMSADPRNESKI